MRPAAATYVGTTDHSSPQRVQVKYSNSHVIAVTIGGPCEWQRGHVPNGAGLGFKFSVGDMELTPGPRCSVQCWGSDELSRPTAEVVPPTRHA